jgi:mannose-1-phosphate guanylyltransferase
MKALILAAGLGTRLRPITDVYAKPALPFLNIPLLYYSTTLLGEASVTELVINAHYKPEQIVALSQEIKALSKPVQISLERDAPLGSGGGIWKAKQFLYDSADSSFLLANGDEVIFPSTDLVLPRFMTQHQASPALATLFVMQHPGVGTQFGGVWADDEGFVHGFGKTEPAVAFGPPRPLRAYHYVGLQALRAAIFDFLPSGESNILYDALTKAIHKGHRVQIFEDQCRWFETGNPSDFLKATKECLTHDIQDPKSFLHKVLRLYSPSSNSKGFILSATDCTVDVTAHLEGFVVIGSSTAIGAGAQLKNVVVLPGTKVSAGSVHSNEILLA